MKKILKWTGIVILSLIGLLLLTSWFLSHSFMKEFDKTYALDPVSINIPGDSASIERGRTLTVSCRNCHDVDLGGKVFFDDPKIGTLPSSNLTRAKGSETEGYTTEDYIRALRHGLNKTGHRLMIMPSESYTHFSDEDLGCIIAYLQSLPPVERRFPMRHFKYMARAMAGAGMFGNLFAYNVIDHEAAKHVTAPPVSSGANYGEYIMAYSGCKTCHGADLGGGVSPDPVSPPVPNISMSSAVGTWTLEQFTNTFRSGKTPEGKVLQGEFMPFAGIGALSDIEIESLYNYIRSLPPAEVK